MNSPVREWATAWLGFQGFLPSMMSGPVVACWRMFFFRRSTRAAERGAAAPLSAPLGIPKFLLGGTLSFSPKYINLGGNQNFSLGIQTSPFQKCFVSHSSNSGRSKIKNPPLSKRGFIWEWSCGRMPPDCVFCCELAYEQTLVSKSRYPSSAYALLE